MKVLLDTNDVNDYRKFLSIKMLPTYSIRGREATFPDKYAGLVGMDSAISSDTNYHPSKFLMDYQRDISAIAIRNRKFAVFADCGLGKTLIMLEFARHAATETKRPFLIISPLMVIEQTIAEAKKFYGEFPIEIVRPNNWDAFVNSNSPKIGITNYECIKEYSAQGIIGGIAVDESSMLKSHYGKWGTDIIRLGRGIDWKLCLTGTPAPNDRIEFANHAVFLDQFPTVNSFLAKFFVNRGQTNERWELKHHAKEAFYVDLSNWSIFLTNPKTYGWKDNSGTIPPIKIHIHDVDLTDEQSEIVTAQTGTLFAHHVGGITNRTALARIAKGSHRGKKISTRKPEYIRNLVQSFGDESTIIWCLYNDEQDGIAAMFPDAASISGSTNHETRMKLIEEFKSGTRKVLISKSKILGFGLNLQICTRQVFSGLQDSYESFYQAVKRSNRYGSTKPLNVHIPVTDIELPMVENVLRKANRIQQDTADQELIFKKHGIRKESK